MEKYIQGNVRHYKGGSFYLVERDLSQINSGKIGEFIGKHKDLLLLKNMRRQFPGLEHIPKQDMLFFDIETCGLDFGSPIISIATAHMHRAANMTLQCAFARNYSEEKAVIQYFLDMLSSYEAFFSYNGKSFDAPRIQERAIHNGLYDRNRKRLNDLLNGHNGEEKHHDLYHMGQQRSRIHLNDGKLKSLEKILFGFIRKGDIDSEDIPQVYYEYAYGRERMTEKVVAYKDFWRECLNRARACISPGLPEQEAETQARTLAKSFYDERFSRITAAGEEEEEKSGKVQGGYTDRYHPGEKIDEEERKQDIARLINHNLLDVASVAAVLCYLCAPHPEQIILPAEDLKLESDNVVPF